MMSPHTPSTAAPIPVHRSKPAITRRGIQIDLGRVIERPETIARLIDTYASLRYNAIQFYFEDALRFPSHPKLARPWAWTLEQAMSIAQRARSAGMAVIPAIQSLGHCTWVGSHPDYRELDETCERNQVAGVLCPSHPRTLTMLQDMIRDVAPLASDPDGAGIIHLGLDESFTLGVCSRCKPRCAELGEGGIFVEHANTLAAFTRSLGKRPAIWGDMFYYYPQSARQLHRDIIIFDWYYYAFDDLPRIEMFNFAPIDTLAMWRELGHEVWGCPSSVFTTIMPVNLPSECVANARSWSRYLRQHQYDSVMVTQWELKPTSIDLSTLTEAAISLLLWDGDDATHTNTPELLQRASAYLYDRPAIGALIEELGQLRLHGHCARRWLNAPSLEAMITYQGDARDQLDQQCAARLRKLDEQLRLQSPGAQDTRHAQVFSLATRWLAYQYDKRFSINVAAKHAVAARWRDARRSLQNLPVIARELAELWQQEWNRNRFAEDGSLTPARLCDEAAMFERELQALDVALNTSNDASGYTGALQRAVVVVHVRNTSPATPCFSLETSNDGVTFTNRGRAWVLEFDSHAARPCSDEELVYAFAVERLEDVRLARVTALGVGGFTLTGIELCHGSTRLQPQSILASTSPRDATSLLRAKPGQANLPMGLPDPRLLFNQLLAQGRTNELFIMEHDAVTVAFD